MIKHIVMFKFKESANGKTKAENLIEARGKMLALKDEIKEIASLDVCFNCNQEDSRNYDYILISEFETLEDLNDYQNHPSHRAFGAYISELREERASIDFTLE